MSNLGGCAQEVCITVEVEEYDQLLLEGPEKTEKEDGHEILHLLKHYVHPQCTQHVSKCYSTPG